MRHGKVQSVPVPMAHRFVEAKEQIPVEADALLIVYAKFTALYKQAVREQSVVIVFMMQICQNLILAIDIYGEVLRTRIRPTQIN